MADFVASTGKIRNLDAGLDAAADALGAVGEASDGACDRTRQQQRQHDHDGGGDAADLEDREPLGGDHLVDVVALRRQHQRAVHGAEALHRHRDRNDHLAAVVDAHHARLDAVERLYDFAVALAVLRPEFAVERQVTAVEPGAGRDRGALEDARLLQRRWWQLKAQHVTAAVQIAAVEDHAAVAAIDAGAGLGRRNQPPQHRSDPLRIDREIQPGIFVRHAIAFAGLEVEQPVRIDGDGVGFNGSGCRDGAGDDLGPAPAGSARGRRSGRRGIARGRECSPPVRRGRRD